MLVPDEIADTMSSNRSPDTPTGASSYQVNINRKKTRKWVEAKVQNYDGDDWGTDEYDDDDEPPPPPVPRVTTGLRPAGQRLPSESKPSARLVAAAAAGSARSASGPPSLRLQTQQQQQSTTAGSASATGTPLSTQPLSGSSSVYPDTEQSATVPSAGFSQSRGPVQDVISPVSARTSSPAPVPGHFPPRKSSIGQQNAPEIYQTAQLSSTASSIRSGHSAALPRTASPAGHSTPDKPSPMVRPSELYRQDRSSNNSPHPSVDSVLTKPSVRSVSPVEEPARQAPSEKVEEKPRLATQPTLDSIAERKSEPGLNKLPVASQNTQPTNVYEAKNDNKTLGDEIDGDRKSMSVSPQLPDVARMSFFGPDLFASTTKDYSDAPPVPATPTQLRTKQEPPTIVSQPASGTGPPSIDRSSTSTPQSLPVSSPVPSVPESSMDSPETTRLESKPASGLQDSVSGPPSDAKGPVSSKPLSVASKAESQQGGVSPISDQASHVGSSSATDTNNQKPNLYPTSGVHSIPPLRTPSPNAKGPVSTVSSHDDSTQQSPSIAVSDLSASSQAPTTNITPTEPLQPRRSDQSPIDFEPRPMQREPTISTVASSPVKESDVLSDEIMKSLSPVGPAPVLAPGSSLAPGPRGDLRSSTYTLSGYDDYWAESTDKPDSKEVEDDDATPMPLPAPASLPAPVSDPIKKSTEPPAVSVNAYEATTITSTEPKEEKELGSGTDDSRRRFSWEASFDDKPKESQKEPPNTESSGAGMLRINSPSSLGTSTPGSQSPKEAVPEVTSSGPEPLPRGPEPPSLVIPTSGGISHQVSKASTAAPTQQPTYMLEPPSPVSVMSERHGPSPPENRPVSVLQDDKQSSHTPTTPPPDDRPLSIPAYAPPPYQLRHEPAAAAQPVLTMREIMNMQGSSEQKLAKYEEARQSFASTETGLQNWILAIKNQHPEYATATSNFNGGLPVSRQGLHTPTASVSHPSSQQPYYQQYLNASSPAVNAPGSSRSRLGGLPHSSPGTSSTFGNSSSQIGSKGKDFMHTAGKMGKGLLSKGKSKLRGTGEKVFH